MSCAGRTPSSPSRVHSEYDGLRVRGGMDSVCLLSWDIFSVCVYFFYFFVAGQGRLLSRARSLKANKSRAAVNLPHDTFSLLHLSKIKLFFLSLPSKAVRSGRSDPL